MKANLAKFLQEDNGTPSSMRIMSILVVVLVLGAWAFCSVMAGVLQDLPAELAALVVGVMGVKSWQKGKEKPKGDSV